MVTQHALPLKVKGFVVARNGQARKICRGITPAVLICIVAAVRECILASNVGFREASLLQIVLHKGATACYGYSRQNKPPPPPPNLPLYKIRFHLSALLHSISL